MPSCSLCTGRRLVADAKRVEKTAHAVTAEIGGAPWVKAAHRRFTVKILVRHVGRRGAYPEVMTVRPAALTQHGAIARAWGIGERKFGAAFLGVTVKDGPVGPRMILAGGAL